MTPWAEALGHGLWLMDGAMGSELRRRGLRDNEASASWNLTHPAEVRAVTAAYRALGSVVLLTNTLVANRPRLELGGWDQHLVAINRAGVRLAREAAGGAAYVLGSLGPVGPGVADERARAAFVEHIEVLADAGVEGLWIETMTEAREAVAACAAAARAGLPVTVTFVVRRDARGTVTTLAGDPLEDAARRVAAQGCQIIGVNCVGEAPIVVEAVAVLRAATSLPIAVRPSAGTPTAQGGGWGYPVSSETFAQGLRHAVDAGARIVGGCCGAGPGHLEAAARVVAAWSGAARPEGGVATEPGAHPVDGQARKCPKRGSAKGDSSEQQGVVG